MTWNDIKLGDVVHHLSSSHSYLVIAAPRPYDHITSVVCLKLFNLDTGKTYVDTRNGKATLSPAFWRLETRTNDVV